MRSALLKAAPIVLALAACGDGSTSSDATADAVAEDSPDAAEADADATLPDGVPLDVAPDVTTEPTDDAADAADTSDDALDGIPANDVDAAPDAVEADVAPPAEPQIYLTIADVPPSMNGSVPSLGQDGPPLTWRLRANRAHVTLDVVPTATSGPIDPDSVTVTCTADGAPHALPAVTTAADGHRRVVIDEASAFPDGAAIACDAAATGPGGAAEASFAFDAATLPPDLDPFPAVDEWLVVLSRDIFALKVTRNPDGTAVLKSDRVTGGNGLVDFDEPFVELGLFSTEHPDKAAIVKAHMLRKIRAYVYAFYGLDEAGAPRPDGVPLHIWFEGDPGAPSPADYGGERRFSKIALGGDGDLQDQAQTTFGRALIDWNNQDTEDDTVYGLGIFPTSLARQVLGQDLGAIVLEPYRVATGGLPFGDDPEDDYFLGQDLEGADLPPGASSSLVRIEIYNLFVKFGSLALASILSHEIGHSLGLVPYGLPPEGLGAGVDADFVVSVAPDAHIDTEGLNIMQTGGSVNWMEAIGGAEPRFEPLSWAYLTRQLVVGPVVDR